MSITIRIQNRNRFNPTALICLVGFVVLGFLPAMIAGSMAAGGML